MIVRNSLRACWLWMFAVLNGQFWQRMTVVAKIALLSRDLGGQPVLQ